MENQLNKKMFLQNKFIIQGNKIKVVLPQLFSLEHYFYELHYWIKTYYIENFMKEKDEMEICGTYEYHKRFLDTDPEYKKDRLKIERFTQEYIKNNSMAGLFTSIVTIPVVVHVVYNTDKQNISDIQIQSQINRLNIDFRRLNPDLDTAPQVFQSLAADTRIQFQLALRDPNCNPTKGITRTYTTVTSFTNNDDVKFGANGGHDAWPRDKYLNLWVCNLGGSILGYSSFPGSVANIDGVVIKYTAFGDIGTATAPVNMGRVATHEIGHWLNLFHIWGDDGGLCNGTDEVDDTPNQGNHNSGCPSFPCVSCDNQPNGDMYMNYMDYTNDRCRVMFTLGQAARMEAALYGARSAVLDSNALIPPSQTHDTADLWSKDTDDDIGYEPNTLSEVVYASNDIWVRRQNDGFTNQEHENPEYRASSSDPNYVYVRIRNKNCSKSGSGTVKLYWAKASTALGWPAPWDGSVTSPALMGDSIGSKPIGSVEGGSSVILEFPWYPPDPSDYSSFGADKSHFCLLSRIETLSSQPFGMTFVEGSNLVENVRNNNSIAWKNVTIVDVVPNGSGKAYVTVGNIEKYTSLIKLAFASPKEKNQKSILELGTIRVYLEKRLFNQWEDGGSVGEGIKFVGNNWIEVLTANAWISNIKIESNEFHTIEVRFIPFNERVEQSNVLFFDITQYAYEEVYRFVGGQRFVFKALNKH